MKNKKVLLFSGAGIFVLTAAIIYWFYFSAPEALPTNGEMLEKINKTLPEATARTIQAAIFIDDKHVYAPFVSEKGDYGKSFWVWEGHKWKAAYIDTKGRPLLWKINRKSPTTYHIVWNIHPNDKLSFIKYYLVRERGYHISDSKEVYTPRVQMGKKVSLKDQTYGVLKMPNEWVSFMNSFFEVESAKRPHFFFSGQQLFFCWTPYNQSGVETFPKNSVNGDSFSAGTRSEVIDYLMILDEDELE